MIGVVTLIAVGPQRLPGMLKNLGQWMRKLRKMTTDVRAQTGIDDILRAEGLSGGMSELRSLVRGGPLAAVAGSAPTPAYRPAEDPFRDLEIDVTREYPAEGPDAMVPCPTTSAATTSRSKRRTLEATKLERRNSKAPKSDLPQAEAITREMPTAEESKSEA